MIDLKAGKTKRQRKKHLILLTNDDGFFSEGIEVLRQYLEDLGEIFVVAPDRERSATSLSLTLHRPLRAKKIKRNVYAVDGTPADCVYLAFRQLLPKKPSLLISGMNHGPNVGQQDISYSGTVAGAIQGAFLGIPSVAISVSSDSQGQFFFDFSARISYQIAKVVLRNRLPESLSLNVNIPPPPVKAMKVVKLGQKRYNPEIIEKRDPRKDSYYWIGAGNPQPVGDEDSDVVAIKEGFITITPLHPDATAYTSMQIPVFSKLHSLINDEIFQKTV